MLLLLFLWFLLRQRSGGGDIYLLHARTLLGGAPLGQAIPQFPGSSVWIAYLIAAFEWIAIQLGPFREIATSSALDRIEPSVRALLPGVWSILAASLVLIGARITDRLAGLARPVAPSAGRPVSLDAAGRAATPQGAEESIDFVLSFRFVLRVLALLLLALSPTVGRWVTSLSPALPAALILFWMTWRLLDLVEHRSDGRFDNAIASGIRDGLPAGVILAWAPFAWPAALLYLAAIAIARAPVTRIVTATTIALGAGLVLDVSRLMELGDAIQKIRLEWARQGGWPLLSEAFGTSSLGHVLFGEPALAWMWLGAFSTCVVLFSRRIGGVAIWISGLWILFRVVPAIAGVRWPGAVQESAEPLWVSTAAILVAIVPRARAPRPAWLYRAVAVTLLIGSTLVQAALERRGAAPSPTLGIEVAKNLQQKLEPGDLCVLERAIPGGEGIAGVIALPRDSRDPERYDFVYWSRWYAGFRYVLVSEAQVRENLERDSPIARHFYQRLATDARPIAEFGDPIAYRLFELPPESGWREAITREELASVRPVPELGSFLSQLGSLYAENGNRRAAMVLFEEGVRLDPASDALSNNLGSIYLLEREWSEAARIFQTVLDRRPDSPEILYNYARALFELNVYVRAETMYRRAIALRPDFAAAHYELARCFLAQDKKLLAAAALQRYLELEPESARRPEVEGVLATLANEGIVAPPSGSGVDRVDPGME